MSFSDYLAEDYTVFLTLAVFTFPTVLAQAIPVMMKKNSPPMMSFIFSLVINCGYALLVYGYLYEIAWIVLFSVGGFFTLFPFDLCCCSTNFNGNHLVIREILSKKKSKEEFMQAMQHNRAMPPNITVFAEAYHYETRVVSNGKNSHTERRKVVTWRDTKPFLYVSWMEDGHPIRMRETSVIHAVCEAHYRLEGGAKEQLDYMCNYMRQVALTHDREASVATNFQVRDFIETVTGSASDKPSSVLNFYQSFWGRFLWFIFVVIGYQSLFEAPWCAEGERMRLRLKKRVSCQQNRRCRYEEEDHAAAEATFRFGEYTVTGGMGQMVEAPNCVVAPAVIPGVAVPQVMVTQTVVTVKTESGVTTEVVNQPGLAPQVIIRDSGASQNPYEL